MWSSFNTDGKTLGFWECVWGNEENTHWGSLDGDKRIGRTRTKKLKQNGGENINILTPLFDAINPFQEKFKLLTNKIVDTWLFLSLKSYAISPCWETSKSCCYAKGKKLKIPKTGIPIYLSNRPTSLLHINTMLNWRILKLWNLLHWSFLWTWGNVFPCSPKWQ